MTQTIQAYANHDPDSPLVPHTIERREPLPSDVVIDITHCGVCHSDIHTVENDWGVTKYPCVPGHEIIGVVRAVGTDVQRFAVGDLVGVGCLVDACRTCNACEDDLEQYCHHHVGTYNNPDKHSGGHTFGGYSTRIVVDEHFVLRIPKNLDPAEAAPLLCAGITTWSPLRHWQVGAKDRIAIVGMGGLGHMAVQFGKALGAHVTVITRSEQKRADILQQGADAVLLSTDAQAMKQHRNQFDFILNTVPVRHDVNPYLSLLKRDATMVMVGAIEPLEPVHGGALILERKNLAGSLIGGIKETQEMLDFCGEHNITCAIEPIAMQDINQAFERVKKADVRYRFVIDMASLG